jgi:twitching motility protein PilT
MSSLTLNDLPFIDLYVRLDQPNQALFRSKEKGKGQISQLVPADFQIMIDRFTAAVNSIMHDHSDGVIDFEGVRCRLSRQKMADETIWVCARRINTVIPNIDDLGMAPHFVQHMKGLGIRDGLILVSGATGAGKTTTAVALLAHFLRTYGGTAVTIEDPAEYLLKGRHGDNGQCFQVEVHQDEDWAACLKRSLRWAPRYIYVGEIRTPKAAEQLLRAATTGHLVITTVHASTLEEALMGIVFLAEQAMGPGVQNILGSGFTAAIHQTMRESGLWLKYLYTDPDVAADPIRALIRDNKLNALSTYVERTAAKLANPNGQPLSYAATTAAKKT